MIDLIVFGANGRTGRRVVHRALMSGRTVTAAIRNRDTFADFVTTAPHRERLTVAFVDALDSDAVAAAAGGHLAAVSAVGGGRKTNHLLARSARSIVDALNRAGIQRLECISSGGAQHDDPNLGFLYGRIISPLLMNDVYQDVRDMEAIVEASDLDWTLVRPAYLTDKPGRGHWRTADRHTPPKGWRIARDDLATFIVDDIDSSEWIHRHPTLAW